MNQQRHLPSILAALVFTLFVSSCATSVPVLDPTDSPSETVAPSPAESPIQATSVPTETDILTDVPVLATNTSPATPGGNLLCTDNLIAGSPWQLDGENDADEKWIDFDDQHILADKDAVQITYDLHGLMAQEGDGKNDSAIVFTQDNSWFGVSLANPKYGENGLNGPQTVVIPLADFLELPNPYQNIQGGDLLNLDDEVSSIRARFWHRDPFIVDITNIQLCSYP
jgi:hypothetical protein